MFCVGGTGQQEIAVVCDDKTGCGGGLDNDGQLVDGKVESARSCCELTGLDDGNLP